jgi:hypothetical protein
MKNSPHFPVTYALVIFLLVGGMTSTRAGVVFPANNGFESPDLAGGYQYNVTGASWTFNGNSGIASNGSGFDTAGATQGQNSDGAVSSTGQAAFIQSNGVASSVKQSVKLAAGTYNVSFSWEGRNGEDGANAITVSLGGQSLFSGTPAQVTFLNQVTTATVTLAAGTYALVFTGSNSGDDDTTFIDNVSINTTTTATATWVGGHNGGDFNTASNWNTGIVPGPNDTAIINSKYFTVSGLITAGTVEVNEPYTATAGGNTTFQITGKWTFSQGFALASGQSFQVTGGGSIAVATATPTLAGASLYVEGGSSLTFTNLASYAYAAPAVGNEINWTLVNDGSQLSFPALKTISMPGTPSQYFNIEADADNDGGTNLISFPVLTSITKADDGAGYQDSGISLSAASGGEISAPDLTTFKDNSAYPGSSIAADAASTLALPKVTSLVGVSLTLGSLSNFPPSLTSYSGNLTVSSSSTSPGNLTSLSGSVTVNNGAQVTFSKVTNIAGLTSIYVSDSGTKASFPDVTSFTAPADTNVSWQAEYSGELDFPKLKTIIGPVRTQADNQYNLTVTAEEAGGIINFAALTSIQQPAPTIDPSTVSNGNNYVDLTAEYSGEISAPLLNQFKDALSGKVNGDGNGPASSLTAFDDGTLSLPKLLAPVGIQMIMDGESNPGQFTSLVGTTSFSFYGDGTASMQISDITGLTEIYVDNYGDSTTAKLSFPNVTSESGSITLSVQDNGSQGTELSFPALTTVTGTVSIQTNGGTMSFPVLKSIAGGSVDASNGTTLSFPDLTSVNEVGIQVYSGSTVSFPAVTSYSSASNGESDEWYINGTGSQLNFPALKTIAGAAYVYSQYFTLYVNNGATLNLPVLTSITQSDAGGYYGAVSLSAKEGGALSAPMLGTFNDTGAAPSSSMSDDSASSIYVPKLTTVVGLALDIDDASTLAQLTSITASTLSVDAGKASLSSLKSIAGLTSISISGGAQVTFPKVRGDSGMITISVQDTGKQGTEVNFPALTTITTTSMYPLSVPLVVIQGAGGRMNFPVLKSIAVGSIAASNSSKLSFPDLTSVSGLVIIVNSLTTLSFPAVASYSSSSKGTNTGEWYVSGTGAQLNFPALKTIAETTYANSQGLVLYANTSGTLNLPVLTSITQSDAGGYTEGYVSLAAGGGTISAPLLATFDDNGSQPESSLTLSGPKSALYVPDLMSSGVNHVKESGISQGAQTLAAFATIPTQMDGTPYTVTPPVASSNYPVTVTVVSGPATISGYQLTFTGSGTVTLAANQPGNLLYTAAPQITTSFTVAKSAQTITFPAVGAVTVNQAVTLAATSSSGLNLPSPGYP